MGLPTTVQLSGTSFVITVPAPTITLFPICISPMMITLAPNVTLLPIVGIRLFMPSFLFPNVVFWRKEKL